VAGAIGNPALHRTAPPRDRTAVTDTPPLANPSPHTRTEETPMAQDPDQPQEDRIEQLVAREKELREHADEGGRGLTDDEQAELDRVQVRLDQLWDLLRQRRALREAGRDPDDANVRDADTVEHYEQ
jgi:hypothetical protein